jgi:phospholipid/cholesterol/gamma-HCH transport system substrate-binding protein
VSDQQPARTHYIHRTTYSFQERLVGTFVLGALLMLLLLFVYNREAATLFADKFTVIAYMKNAQGVTENTKITISGVDVGRVRSFDVAEGNQIRIELEVLERFHPLVREDSRAALSKLSMIGKASIEITAGSADRPLLPDGAIILVDEPLSIDAIMADVVPALRNAQRTLERINQIAEAVDPKDVNRMVKSVQVTTANMEKLTTQMTQGRGAAGQLLSNDEVGRDVATSVRLLAATLEQTEQRMKELGPVLKDAQAATAEVRKASEGLPQLIDETHRLVGQLNTTMGTVNYEMQQLPDLVIKTRQLMEQVDRTLRALQSTWPISSSVQQPPEEQVVAPRPTQ